MARQEEKNGVLFFDYNMAREEFEKKLYNMFVKEDYSLDTIISWAISYGELHNHWISVEDKLPEYDQKVLWCWDDGLISIGRVALDEQHIEAGYITHWMPLPQPPKKGGEK